MIIYRKGEPREVSTKNEMKISEAITKLARYGFTDDCIQSDIADVLVVILSDYWDNGREVAKLHRTRGKYRGNAVGFVLRP